ncbi:hypothetical protein ACGFMK_34900 [Amycolatopsis sp. NPDC049252]|uniref:hypothetical protein n=1 Tax=Amycolatopsis sp. NPDC049252 TaxID=3363933 RepID=UPI003720710C
MRLLNRTLLVIASIAGATTIGTVAAVTASGTETTDDSQPSVVEDFSYPGADRILATDHVQLISGDGHILYTACPQGPDTVGLIIVRTTEEVGSRSTWACFQITGPSGHLTLKIPGVYSIKGDGLNPGQGHKLKAGLTTDAGEHSTVDVNPSGTTQVGITTTPPGDPTTLLQLDASS